MTNSSNSSQEAPPILLPDYALFLDFDGTLAPLQNDPDAVVLSPRCSASLLSIAKKLSGALVLISGRDVRDLTIRVPSDLWRAGGHGLDICRPGEQPKVKTGNVPSELLSSVRAIANRFQGVRLEEKSRVLAIHYRQNPPAGPMLIREISTLVKSTENYYFQHGKMVIELKPIGVDKGSALKMLMQQAPFAGRIPIMVGDDTTDEDAILAATDLGGFGIKVGLGASAARYRLEDPAAVWKWLEKEDA